jgi:hypothetical protein
VSPRSGDDTPVPLRELARRAGVSDGTLRNWAQRPDRPLQVQRTGSRSVSSTVNALRAFCADHGGLPAARTALARLNHPVIGLDPAEFQEVLAVVVAAVRAATAAHVELAQASTGLADNAATVSRVHADALSRLLPDLDDAMTRLSPPSDRG